MISKLFVFVFIISQVLSQTPFQEADLDGNKALSFNEFKYLAEHLPTMKETHLTPKQLYNTLKVLFLTHDKDENLELSKKEYNRFVRLIARTDAERVNKDGSIGTMGTNKILKKSEKESSTKELPSGQKVRVKVL